MVGFLHVSSSVIQVGDALRDDGSIIKDNFYIPNEQVIKAKEGLNDQQLEDIEIPATDIYFQEYFFYAYSFLTNERKGFVESKEGFTYIK